ncbi:ABC transporter ATP-binding protein [Mesorhizobium sp. L-8-3]|uniref:ABC transporter ATP-binding protein n=1 Tax=Mesorhizobium sp. L-8-3 TaxID=2744522 RepID=UPI001925634D|nr:ABC transporter ATP-binding protein [Mesorhizobium sp. L-8-3]BCH27988.1 ABC transporter ATP-binding protein [Mesorhizobium sp. L-8-3]
MKPVLSVEGLTVRLTTGGRSFDAVSDLGFQVAAGEVLALVGESGSGKSMTALSVMRLLPPAAEITAGSMAFGDLDLAAATEHDLRAIRGNRIGLIFQEPMTALNPTMRVGWQVAEALELHKGMDGAAARRRVEELFDLVRIPDPKRRFDDYPHQMSGGMRQRVVIALALACDPDLLIADEPTTALDVTTQAQILDLLRDLQSELGMATILITHDLAVVAETADRVAVMYAGRIVEQATAGQLFAAPRHPYTHGLLGSIPHVTAPDEATTRGRLAEIKGTVPALWDLPEGCAFAPRCPRSTYRCRKSRPPLVEVVPLRQEACWHPVGDAR